MDESAIFIFVPIVARDGPPRNVRFFFSHRHRADSGGGVASRNRRVDRVMLDTQILLPLPSERSLFDDLSLLSAARIFFFSPVVRVVIAPHRTMEFRNTVILSTLAIVWIKHCAAWPLGNLPWEKD